MLPNLSNLGDPTAGPSFFGSSKKKPTKEEPRQFFLHDAGRERLTFRDGVKFGRIMETLTAANGHLNPGEQLLIAAPAYTQGNVVDTKVTKIDDPVGDLIASMVLLTFQSFPTDADQYFSYIAQRFDFGNLTINTIARPGFDFARYQRDTGSNPVGFVVKIPKIWSSKYMNENKDTVRPQVLAYRSSLYPNIPKDAKLSNDYFIFRFAKMPSCLVNSQLVRMYTPRGKEPVCF